VKNERHKVKVISIYHTR